MRRGKHCFVQKPLTHSLHEARVLARLARENKVATQMGNQGTASRHLRRAAALIRAGLLGRVSEVHIWTDRPIWPQGLDRPAPVPPPKNLNWDLWLGPAPARPFSRLPSPDPRYGTDRIYHDFAWRGWWDFGTGALGDIACHAMNMTFPPLICGTRLPFRPRPRATTATAFPPGRSLPTSSRPPPPGRP